MDSRTREASLRFHIEMNCFILLNFLLFLGKCSFHRLFPLPYSIQSEIRIIIFISFVRRDASKNQIIRMEISSRKNIREVSISKS